ncbi:MAG: peptidoglycan-binding domain-containing protein [Paracoccaceae bacterium]|jgi:hypothetical protein
MRRKRVALGALCGVLMLGGCMDAPAPQPQAPVAQTLARALGTAPPAGAPGCYATIETRPVTFGTVKRAVEIRPAQIDPKTGRELAPALYEEQEFSAVLDGGESQSFETLCPAEETPELIASMQRALKARGLYRGAISGRMEAETRRALRAYQAPRGLPSDVVSRRALMEMGLLVWQD